MKKMKSGNPAVKLVKHVEGEGQASFQGILNRTMFSIFLVVLSASFVWLKYQSGNADSQIFFYMLLGGIGGFIVALLTAIGPGLAPITVPIYALLEGLFLGAVSARYNNYVDGLIIPAIVITFGILLVMLFLYRFRVIRATDKFKKCIFIATCGVAGIYLMRFLLSLIGINVPFIHQAGTGGIIISLIIIVIASLNFIVDFDSIDEIVNGGAPKQAEWIGVFGILTTLVWLYLEVIRLLYLLKRD